MRSRAHWCLVLAIATAGNVCSLAPAHGDVLKMWRGHFALRPVVPPPAQSGSNTRSELGARLFRDYRLSGDGKRACVTCHDPTRAFTDGLARAAGKPGQIANLRNTPTLYNLAAAKIFNWDGSAASLEEQVVGPIQNPAELGSNFPDIIERLGRDKAMVAAFVEAFPKTQTISQDSITKALASYVRILEAPKTSFDDWLKGDETALTDQQKVGLELFVGKGGCVACHAGPRMTDEAFHDIGLPDDRTHNGEDVAGKKGVRAFKTPTLRAVSKTAPYMHNGQLQSLGDVVNHYADGIIRRPGVSGILPRQLKLSKGEKAALVAFLNML